MTRVFGRVALVVLTIIVLGTTSIRAAENAQVRLITVVGEGELWIDANEVSIRLGVETFAVDLGEAKSRNDQNIKRVLALVNEYKIEQKYVRTSQITIQPKYKDRNDPTTLIGYSVQNSISIMLKDINKFDAFITDALKAGANSLSMVEFRSSEIGKYKDQALAMAVKAAQDKAVKLANELGRKVGKPYSIQEGGIVSGAGDFYMAGAVALSRDTYAPGQIRVYARVTVSFELE